VYAVRGAEPQDGAAGERVAIDGSKLKTVNNRDKIFTKAKVERRRTQLEQSVARYLAQLNTADRQEPSETIELKKTRLNEKLTRLKSEMAKLEAIERQLLSTPDQQISLTDPDSRSMATSGRGSGPHCSPRARRSGGSRCRRPFARYSRRHSQQSQFFSGTWAVHVLKAYFPHIGQGSIARSKNTAL
jgi:hypothetical protein